MTKGPKLLDANDLKRAGRLPLDPFASAALVPETAHRGPTTEARKIAAATGTQVDEATMPSDWSPLTLPGSRKRTTSPAALEALLAVLPTWARPWVEAKASQLEIDPVLPAVGVLAAIAACVQRKAWLVTSSGYRVALTLWVVVLAESGGGKSTVLSAAIEAITEWERDQAIALRAQQAGEFARWEVKEREYKRALRDVERAKKPDDVKSAREDAERFRAELSGMTVPHLPQIVCRAPTAARLAQLLQEQQGRMGLFHAEVDLPTLLGLRSRDAAPTDSTVLEAWDGNDVAEERLKREDGLGGDRIVPKAHLTMGIATQPTKLARLLKRNPDLLDNGFFARCLYLQPEDLADRATFAPHPIPAHIEEGYRTGLRRLLEIPYPDTTEIPVVPLSAAAEQRFVELRKALQLEKGRGGGMHAGPLRSWAERAHSQALHLAGVLHVAGHPTTYLEVPLSAETMDRAVRAVLEVFVPSAKNTLALLGASPSARLVDSLLGILRRFARDPERSPERRHRCGARELYRAAGCEAAEVTEPLSELVECGALMPLPPPTMSGPGRHPSPEFWIHPDLGGEQ